MKKLLFAVVFFAFLGCGTEYDCHETDEYCVDDSQNEYSEPATQTGSIAFEIVRDD